MKKRQRKNPHAVALGRLGGMVRSEAKKRANQQNGRKGGLVKSRKKTIGKPGEKKFSPLSVRGRWWRSRHHAERSGAGEPKP